MNNLSEELYLLKRGISVIKNRKRLLALSFVSLLVLGISLILYFNPSGKTSYVATTSFIVSYDYGYGKQAPETVTEGFIYYQDRIKGYEVDMIFSFLDSDQLYEDVIKQYRLKDAKGKALSKTELEKKIAVTKGGNSGLYLVRVKDDDSKLAVELSQFIPRRMAELAKNIEDLKHSKISIVDNGTLAIVKPEMGFGSYVLTIMMLSIIGAIFITFLVEILDPRIGILNNMHKITCIKQSSNKNDLSKKLWVTFQNTDSKVINLIVDENNKYIDFKSFRDVAKISNIKVVMNNFSSALILSEKSNVFNGQTIYSEDNKIITENELKKTFASQLNEFDFVINVLLLNRTELSSFVKTADKSYFVVKKGVTRKRDHSQWMEIAQKNDSDKTNLIYID